MIFSKLNSSAGGGKGVQHVKVQERGQPKSGTSFSMEWAAETLYHACDYLNGLYRKGSCQISLDIRSSLRHVQLTFKPDSGDQETAIYPCKGVRIGERYRYGGETHHHQRATSFVSNLF